MGPRKKTQKNKEIRNPFEIVSADDLDLGKQTGVKKVRELFISRYTDLATVRKRFNTILEGQRGTGKTMILKYLAFEPQIAEWRKEVKEKPAAFFADDKNFIGVYIKLKQGVFDKKDFESIKDEPFRVRVFEHRLTLHVLSWVFKTIELMLKHVSPEEGQWFRVEKRIDSLLGKELNPKRENKYEDFLTEACDFIADELMRDVDLFLGAQSPGGAEDEYTLAPWLTLSNVIDFLTLLQDCLELETPFYLMFDDFDVLEPYQQTKMFQAAAPREFGIVCFKFGVMIGGRKTSESGPGRTFREGDDYDLVNLDWTAGGLHNDYAPAVEEIAQRRLQSAGWEGELRDYFPDWQYGIRLKEEIKAKMDKEWDRLKKAGKRVPKKRTDYFSKYGNARFFQELASKKKDVVYAGTEDILMVSSGIFRQYLEICKLIIDEAISAKWTPEQGGISPIIQSKAIEDYSERMINQFTKTSGDSSYLLTGEIQVTSRHMVNLVEGLSQIFFDRLHTPGHKEPEIICIAVRDDLDKNEDAKRFLNIAVRESMLHRFKYPPKTFGGPPLPSFMLNRRLGPRRNLSIRRMQGRIEITANDIVLAATDKETFIKKFGHPRKKTKKVKKKKKPGQSPLFNRRR